MRDRPVPSSFQLSEEQVAAFHAEGFLSVPALTTADEVTWLREIYDDLFAGRVGRELGLQFDLAGTDDGSDPVLPQILDPARFAPELNDSLLLANARALVHDLFGPEATCGFFHAILKPALIGAATPWHQDASYWDPHRDYRSVSIWVPLQPATPENGCMQFVPGSHVQELVHPHRSIDDDPRIHGNELRPEELKQVSHAVACPLTAGGATVHGGYTLHYAGPNLSDQPRRALILSGGLPPIERVVPRDLWWQREKRTLRDECVRASGTAYGEP